MKNKIFELFSKNGHDIYLVGGSVRDQLLGLETQDLDFAVSCVPEVTLDILQKAGYKTYTVGIAFGTIGAIIDGYKVECTTFRRNEKYQRDNRNPVVEWGQTIEEDLHRRDFTINCICLDSNNEIKDLFGGVEHLKNKILATPIEAEKSFTDDPLRCIRAVRFRAKLGFEYSDEVKLALKSCAKRLLILPKERILEEMNKILMTDNVDLALNDLFEYRLINYFIPELVALKSIKQESEFHHKDALLHTIDVVKNSPKDLVLRWSSLFHDIGKQCTFSNENGKIHFYDHDEIGSRMTYSILQRLGLPTKMIKDITYLVKNHMRANTYLESWSDTAVRRFIFETGEYCGKLLQLSEADVTSHNKISIEKHMNSLNDLKRRIEEQRNFKESPKCPIDGNAIMRHFNLGQVKQVGEIKEMVLNAVINGELKLGESEDVYLKWVEDRMEMKK